MSTREDIYKQIVLLSDPTSRPLNHRRRKLVSDFRIKMKKYQRLCILTVAVLSAFLCVLYYSKYQHLHHVLDMLDSIGDHSHVRNMTTLHNDFNDLEHRRMYRWFWMKMTDKIDVYSAYHDIDTSEVSGEESVKVFGTIVRDNSNSPLSVKCLLWYSGKAKPDESTASLVELEPLSEENKHLKFSSVMFKCHVSKVKGASPYGVTVMELKSNISPEAMGILKVLRTHRSSSPKRNFSVCVLPPLHGPYDDLAELIQFLEMYKLMGFKRFVFYDFSSSDRIQHLLLEHAQFADFSLEVMHWNFPYKSVHSHNATLEIAANDCIYRTMEYSWYTLIASLDSYIIPRENHNLFNIINSTVSSYSLPPIVTIPRSFFCEEYPDDTGKFLLQIPFKVLIKTRRHAVLHQSRKRSQYFVPVNSIDYMIQPNYYVSILSDVDFSFQPLSASKVLVHVYTTCNDKKIGNSNVRQKQVVVDKTAWLYKDKLLKSKLMSRIHYNF